MSRLRLTASTGVQSLEPKRGYRDGIGYTIEIRYKGTQAECGAALEQLVVNGGVIDASIDHDAGGYYILTAAYSARNATTDTGGNPISGPESVVTTWSRQTSSLEKSLWEKTEVKTAMAIFGAYTDTTSNFLRAEFRSIVEKFFRAEIDLTQFQAKIVEKYEPFSPSDANRQTIAKLCEMFSKGVDTYRVDAFIIQRTQVGAPESLINNDATNNRMWTRASLIADTTMPAAFKASVPQGYFLQYAAELNVLDNAKWQVVQLWQWAETYEDWLWGDAV